MRMVDNGFFYEKPPDPSCKIQKTVYSKDADRVNKATLENNKEQAKC